MVPFSGLLFVPFSASFQEILARERALEQLDVAGRESVAIVVDAACAYIGEAFVAELERRNIRTRCVMSDYLYEGLTKEFGEAPPVELRVPRPGDAVVEWGDERVVCCIAESDAGIATAERLAEELGARFRNAPSPIRRHKWLLHETLKQEGLSACDQSLVSGVDEVRRFFDPEVVGKEGRLEEVVVKPPRGVGSDGVRVCESVEEAEEAVRSLLATERYGTFEKNEYVLLQRRLRGEEYAVDTVSRDGEHKVVAVWRYDKRRIAKDAPRVYFCSQLVSEYPATLEPYVKRALTALDHRNGPTHTEVIDDLEQGPTIVEVNARFHNQDFAPLTSRMLGLTQLQAAAMAVQEKDDEWRKVPASPKKFHGGGRLIHLVAYEGGELEALNHDVYDALTALPTVFKVQVYATEPGSYVRRTVDVTTDAGYILLAGDDKAQVDRDYQEIVQRQRHLFNFISPNTTSH
mmetsp:Transcript_6163/g.20093  ORF Transcript_6163/g.20093 Transcript_6163/m.20093 type:complete len:462 (-) Transcript_6163:193-1578(-)